MLNCFRIPIQQVTQSSPVFAVPSVKRCLVRPLSRKRLAAGPQKTKEKIQPWPKMFSFSFSGLRLKRWTERFPRWSSASKISVESFYNPDRYLLASWLRKLSLSSNMIDKVIGLSGMKNLRVLSLARNYIKSLNGIVSTFGSPPCYAQITIKATSRNPSEKRSKSSGWATISSTSWKASKVWNDSRCSTSGTTPSGSGASLTNCKPSPRWRTCCSPEIPSSRASTRPPTCGRSRRGCRRSGSWTGRTCWRRKIEEGSGSNICRYLPGKLGHFKSVTKTTWNPHDFGWDDDDDADELYQIYFTQPDQIRPFCGCFSRT